MDWFSKHVDMVIILTSIIGSVLWMNGKFNDIDKQFYNMDKEICLLKSEISVVKTVLLMKQILPAELAKCEEK